MKKLLSGQEFSSMNGSFVAQERDMKSQHLSLDINIVITYEIRFTSARIKRFARSNDVTLIFKYKHHTFFGSQIYRFLKLSSDGAK